MKIRIDTIGYKKKPKSFGSISTRLENTVAKEINFDYFCELVGNEGHAFCVADFIGNKRRTDDFKCQQVFGLDFDNNTNFNEIFKRAESNRLPIALAYETFSSVNMSRFRIVFRTAFPIFDRRVAKIVIDALFHIFPECDKQCRDVTRIFLGGKNIILKQEQFLSIENLMMVLPEVLKSRDEKHSKSKVEKFCTEHKLYRSGGFACITQKLTDDTYEFTENGNTFYFNFTDTPENKKTSHKRVRTFNFHIMKDKCKLYREFIEDERLLHHHELFGLACNLNCVERGKQDFLKHIADSQFDHYREKDWGYYIHYMTAQEYKPMDCEKFCPYCDECNHALNPILTSKTNRNSVVKLKGHPLYSCKEAYEDMCMHLYDTLDTHYDGITIIKAQTAIGKTKAYIDYVKNSEKRFIIAVPTNDLKDEVFGRLRDAGVTNIVKTESLQTLENMDDIGEIIRHYNELGAYADLMQFVSEIAKKENKPALLEYIKPLHEYCCTENRVIVTTHKKLLNNKSNSIKDYEVIVDEDILSGNLRTFTEVSISDLLKFNDIPKVKNFLENYSNLTNNYVRLETLDKYISYTKMTKLGITTNVNSFMTATSACVNGNTVNCFTPPQLVKTKYTIVSATADEKVYKLLFPDVAVRVFKCKEAKYKGKLIQDCTRSFSRTDIDSEPNFFRNIKKENLDADNTITFLKYKDQVSDCPLHFGNTEGLDYMKGQNLVVVGTPFSNEKVYKLIACHVGIPTYEKMQFLEVVDDEYKYWINTYKNEDLKNLQLYFIKSDLIQAVGRARLLRNDCTVKLYSCIPLSQAIIE